MAEKKTPKGKSAVGKVKKSSSRAKARMGGETARVADYQILVAPVLSEKSSIVGSASTAKFGPTVVFRVARGSSKHDIKGAIERVFKVEVASVRTANYSGKVKRTTRSQGRRAGYKKAYVTLKKGHEISIVEGL